MEYVSVKKIEAYMWECPKCGHFNIDDKYSVVSCEACFQQFKAQEQEDNETACA